jgi:hypothetical protein
MITGEYMSIQVKRKNDVFMKNGFCLQGITASNDPGTYHAKGKAGNVSRRMLPLHFPNEVKEINYRLGAELEAERFSLLIKGILYLNRLLNKMNLPGNRFKRIDDVLDPYWAKQIIVISQKELDPVEAFINSDWLVFGDHDKLTVPQQVFKLVMHTYCTQNGFGKIQFGTKLARETYQHNNIGIIERGRCNKKWPVNDSNAISYFGLWLTGVDLSEEGKKHFQRVL